MFSSNIHLSDRGYGFGMSLHETSNARINSIYELLFIGLRDNKEIKISNVDMVNTTLTPGAFVYGKVNQFIMMRAGYGKEISLARRPDRNSIGVLWSTSIGLNIGMQSPVFIDYYTPGQNDYDFLTVKYNPSIHERPNIIQSHSFFKGLSEVKLLPGIYTKQALVLEFGSYSYAPNRIEAGFILDTYFARPEIMYGRKHAPVFISFYVSFALLNIGI